LNGYLAKATNNELCEYVDVSEDSRIINARNIHYYTFLKTLGQDKQKILFARHRTWIRDKEYFENLCNFKLYD
jgi:3-deoxy-D-arabino-heptulosonate 7-phosphate (DAHP) synthase